MRPNFNSRPATATSRAAPPPGVGYYHLELMPKDEFDFEDPLELTGVSLCTAEDTTDAMCECFVEEFMRMGYSPKQILALFRNPHYLGMRMVLEKRGEPSVREVVAQVFARWGTGKMTAEIEA